MDDRRRSEAVGQLATQQDGVVDRAQLIEAGMSKSGIARWVRSGRLFRLHPAVYSVGHAAPSRRGRLRAGLLACGPDSAIARRTALELWGVWRPTTRDIDVVTPHRTRTRRGLNVHETRGLPQHHVRIIDGMRVTSPARTLVDLGLELDATQLTNVIHELAYRRRFNRRELVRCLADMQGSPGQPVAAAALAMHDAGSAGTRSELERRVDALLLEIGVDAPARNVKVKTRIGWIELDKSWAGERIYLEVDGAPHARRRTQNADRDRKIALRDAGWTEFRVGFLEMDLDRVGVGERLRARLPGVSYIGSE